MATSSGKPYCDNVSQNNNVFVRTFDQNVSVNELVWHRDIKNRSILVVAGSKWMIQFDNELPFELCAGNIVDIPAMTYHRLFRGVGDLVIEITEFD